jgi:hypothetical protein
VEVSGTAEEIKGEFWHAWNGYKTYAWGFDDLEPLSKTGHNWLYMQATMIDSISTLYLLEEFNEVENIANYLKDNFSF